MSVLRLFPPRRSCAKAVFCALFLSARDELVRRMKSEIVLQFSPEPIDEPIFLDWADDAGDERYWRREILAQCDYVATAESRIEHRVELLSEKAIL